MQELSGFLQTCPLVFECRTYEEPPQGDVAKVAPQARPQATGHEWSFLQMVVCSRSFLAVSLKLYDLLARFPFLAKTGLKSSETARDVSQNPENKGPSFWNPIFKRFGERFWLDFGVILELFWSSFGTHWVTFGVSLGSFG